MSKKILYLLIGLAVIAAVVFVMQKKGKLPLKQNPQQQGNNQSSQLKQYNTGPMYTEPDKAPEKFPADFPIEKGAQILQSYNSETATTLQATRIFQSKVTLKDNYALYEKYLKNNNWKIIASSNAEVKYFTATKNGANLSITMNSNSLTKINEIDVSFEFKK